MIYVLILILFTPNEKGLYWEPLGKLTAQECMSATTANQVCVAIRK